MVEAWAVVECIQYLLRIAGTAASSIGTIIVRYPDLENQRLNRAIKRLVPELKQIEAASEIASGSIERDEGILQTLHRIFEERYGPSSRLQDPQKAVPTSTGFKIEYANGSRRTPYNRTESGKIEMQLLFDWASRKEATNRGMWFITRGFIALLLGTLWVPSSISQRPGCVGYTLNRPGI